MSKIKIPDNGIDSLDTHTQKFKTLLGHITKLAGNKLGYPVSLLTYLGVLDNEILGIKPDSLANVLLNNVGDPFKDSETSLMEVKNYERVLIKILEKFYGLAEDQARGYVTTGGTEGNFASLWWSKRYMINLDVNTLIEYDNQIKLLTKQEQDLVVSLTKIPLNDYQPRAAQLQKIIDTKNAIGTNKNIVQQLLTPTVFFTKGHTHYSIPKISEILKLNIRSITPNADGSMNLDNFKKEILLHLGAHPHSALIVIANIGTTITGAIDDVPSIKKILDSQAAKPHYTIHLDGALTGFVMPILKPFGDVENYFDAIGANTLAVSAHKYPGLSQPCGILLARRQFFEKAFEKSERSVDYVGNIVDSTITGSRSGLNVLMFYNALHTFGLDKNTHKLEKMVEENLVTARYLYQELIKVYGPEQVSYPYHFNVIFPRTSLALAQKYQLMLTGDHATICVLTNVSRKLIDQFIVDLRSETKEKTMSMVKTDYKIVTLTNEHVKSAVELFVKSFCDSEPITKHLGIKYSEYEPFAREVVQKSVMEGLSVVALDTNNRVVACTLAEDITNPFVPNLENYPKLKPVFELLVKLDEPFLKGKTFIKGKIEHIWIAIVDSTFRGKGLSTAIDMACADLAVKKGYEFAYAEFTNALSENITHHYPVAKLFNSIKYDDFEVEREQPFKGVKGGAAAYLIGIKPGINIDSLKNCYSA
jgi:histidine decarboxylase